MQGSQNGGSRPAERTFLPLHVAHFTTLSSPAQPHISLHSGQARRRSELRSEQGIATVMQSLCLAVSGLRLSAASRVSVAEQCAAQRRPAGWFLTEPACGGRACAPPVGPSSPASAHIVDAALDGRASRAAGLLAASPPRLPLVRRRPPSPSPPPAACPPRPTASPPPPGPPWRRSRSSSSPPPPAWRCGWSAPMARGA